MSLFCDQTWRTVICATSRCSEQKRVNSHTLFLITGKTLTLLLVVDIQLDVIRLNTSQNLFKDSETHTDLANGCSLSMQSRKSGA